MRPVLNLSSTFSQTVAETPACSRLRFAVFTLSLWHAKQFFERKGRTLLRYSGWLVSCAAILQQARAPNSAGSVCKFREMAATSTPNIHPLGDVRIQAAVKRCLGEAPDSRDRGGRCVHHFRGLFDRQASEAAEFDDARALGIGFGQLA